MIKETKLHTLECKCLSWKPVVAGALAAIGFTFLLNLFSVAIGLTAYTTDSRGVENLALGGLIATTLGIVASMFAAGWISGYLARRHCSKRHLGALYGFLTWCLALILTVFLTTHLIQYIALYTHFISGTSLNMNVANAAAALPSGVAPATKVVISTYIIFCLFFLSAFACSLGGHSGMRYAYQDSEL